MTRKTKFNYLLTVLWFCASTQSQAADWHSQYSNLTPPDCRTVSSDDQGSRSRCLGPAKYQLELLASDREDVNLIYPSGKVHKLKLIQTVGNGFSHLGKKAEWRFTSGTNEPSALILRFNVAEDTSNTGASTSYLVVSKITSSEACVTAVIKPSAAANELAREHSEQATNRPCLPARF